MGKIIAFGQYKGQEEEIVAQSAKGRAWMRYLANQPVEDNQYRTVNEVRNKRWLELCARNESEGSESSENKEETVSFAISKANEKIIEQLDEIIKVLQLIYMQSNTKVDAVSKINVPVRDVDDPSQDPTVEWD